MRTASILCLLLSVLLAAPSASATTHDDGDGDGIPDEAERNLCVRYFTHELVGSIVPTIYCADDHDLVVIPPNVVGAVEVLANITEEQILTPASRTAGEVVNEAGRLAGESTGTAGRLAGILLTPDDETVGELQAEAGALPGAATDLAEDEAAFVGAVLDADGDRVPDDAEPLLCGMENSVDPSDGTCTDDDYHPPA